MSGSIENRDAFLALLTERLGTPDFEPYVLPSDLPMREKAELSVEELLALAHKQAEFVSAAMLEITSQELTETLQQLIEKAGGGQIMVPTDDDFEHFVSADSFENVVRWQVGADKRDENIQAAQNSNIAIAVPRFFLAESATIVVESHAGQGRSFHFLPTHYIAVVPQSRVVARSTQAAAYYDAHKRPGSTLHFISGPSNSGDIEMQLVVGLHGPLEITYLIVKDL
ncbi:MAG: lactate utilization protein C [Streptococcaceae bacterium]|jgi:L-lactate dehydrogenase complex protein LldG|nr:lactate utilization protein C [Streptococcaceae bacterium]